MSDKPKTKVYVYGIPGDLAEIGVPIWAPADVRRYADKLAARLDDPKIEDKYRLARHIKIERARKLGDRDPYRAAELLRQVEALCDAPDAERGRKWSEHARTMRAAAHEQKRQKWADMEARSEELKAAKVKMDAVWEQVANEFGYSDYTAARRAVRNFRRSK